MEDREGRLPRDALGCDRRRTPALTPGVLGAAPRSGSERRLRPCHAISPLSGTDDPVASTPMVLGRVLAGLPRSDATAVVRDGTRTVLAFGADDVLVAPSAPFAALDALDTGWWSGYFGYEFGHAVERVRPRPVDTTGTSTARAPDLALVRFAARAEIGADGGVELTGTGAARRALERALTDPTGAPDPAPG